MLEGFKVERLESLCSVKKLEYLVQINQTRHKINYYSELLLNLLTFQPFNFLTFKLI